MITTVLLAQLMLYLVLCVWDIVAAARACWSIIPAVRLSEGRGQNNQQPTPNDNISNMTICLTVWKCLTCLEMSDMSDSVWNQTH